MSAQFKIKAADPASVVRLERELGLPRFIAATLVAVTYVATDSYNPFIYFNF